MAGFEVPADNSARHSALNRLAIATLLNRNPGPRPENRSGHAGGQEWCRLALTSSDNRRHPLVLPRPEIKQVGKAITELVKRREPIELRMRQT